MNSLIITVISNILISLFIYLSIAVVLIILDSKNKGQVLKDPNLDFNELLFDYSELPEFESYKARDGSSLEY